jgi:hypothetical protein
MSELEKAAKAFGDDQGWDSPNEIRTFKAGWLALRAELMKVVEKQHTAIMSCTNVDSEALRQELAEAIEDADE